MSQMKPYCFKCGAELDPEAIYCPECGRLQRSMVVRAVEPDAPSAPPTPRPDAPREEPFHFYPDREAPPAQPADAHADQASYQQDPSWQQPDQPDPYAPQYTDQGWAGEQPQPAPGGADQYGHDAWASDAQHGADQVYARQPDEAPAAPDP